MGFGWWASRERLLKLIRVNGLHNLEQAYASDRPVILLVGHFVAIDLAGMYISARQNITSINKPPKNQLLQAMMKKGRSRFGRTTLVEVRDGIKPILRALKKGEPFYFPSDQDFGPAKSIFAPFFGIPAATVPTLGRLAKLSNALVVPCFTRQLPYGKGYEAIFEKALENFPTGDELEDTTRMNAVIEAAVRMMPEQYFWAHRRFKTRPGDTDQDFYR